LKQRWRRRGEAMRLGAVVADLEARLEAETQQAAAKLLLLQGAKAELTDQFRVLANDILEEKSKRFAEQNQASLGQLLDPLRERMTEFRAKVEEIHLKDVEQQGLRNRTRASKMLTSR
jgi:DNA recombination protein RmuC